MREPKEGGPEHVMKRTVSAKTKGPIAESGLSGRRAFFWFDAALVKAAVILLRTRSKLS